MRAVSRLVLALALLAATAFASAPALAAETAVSGSLRKGVGDVIDSLTNAPKQEQVQTPTGFSRQSSSSQSSPSARRTGPTAPAQPSAPVAPSVQPLSAFPHQDSPLPGSAFGRQPASPARPANPAPEARPDARPDEVLRLMHDGQERAALVYVPKAAAHRLPLLIFLHGAGGSARLAARQTGLATKAVRAGFLTVFPEGLAAPSSGQGGQDNPGVQTWNAWNCCGYARDQKIDDVGYLAALIERLKAAHPVDPRRVYLAGFSNGAMLASRFALERPGVAAAIASVAGSVPCDAQPPREPLSVLVIHGNHDRVARFGPVPGQPRSGRFCEDFPAKAQVDFWVGGMGLPARPGQVRDGRNVRARVERYGPSAKSGRALVEFVIVKGGGHAWPGGPSERYRYCDLPTPDPDATALVLDFFQHQARGAAAEKPSPHKAAKPKRTGKSPKARK